ncbi:hypothetical protein CPB83DRAFT_841523 [Crepidotus variabilis]|uniref:Uncharacterized protein n=1 Tax=Crepidotus variabilis TaxID=179855 RepID=A0A9P6JW76_9AGAR|nr:hypothetical protein CPB83DRAFT_841523 [Crepidotus variabilis]
MMTSTSSLAVWSCISAGLLALFASALVLFPRFLLFLSQSDIRVEERSSLTNLESFLAVHFGAYLGAVALTLILNIPTPEAPIPPKDVSALYHPLLVPLTIASSSLAFVSWNTKTVGALATVTFTIDATIGLWGLWTILFASSRSISKTTGADKRTSAFLFGNKAAASSQKKALNKGA